MKRLVCLLTGLFLFISVSSIQAVPDTSLVNAIQNSDREDVTAINSLLAKGADVNEKDYAGNTPLMIALSKGQFEVSKLLISHGANVNPPGDSVLFPAVGIPFVVDGNKEIVNLLLKNGARVNFSNKDGYTPLMAACNSNDAEIAKILVDHGAFVNVQDKDGETPLIKVLKNLSSLPAGKRNSNTVRLLLEHKAKVNVANNFEVTPLFAAVFIGASRGNSSEGDKTLAEEVTKLLLKYGANPNFKSPNRDGYTLLHYAERDKNTKLVNLLKKAGAK